MIQESEWQDRNSRKTESEPHLEAEAPKDKEKVRSYAITIGREPSEVFAFFRDFENLPFFMKDLTAVKVLSATRSHWTVVVKSGAKVAWDVEIINEVPGQSFSWISLEGSPVSTRGTAIFAKAPGDLGTVVSLSLDYSIPGGKLSEFALLFTGETPELLVLTNLKRLKALLETGEVPTTQGQSSGRDEDQDLFKH